MKTLWRMLILPFLAIVQASAAEEPPSPESLDEKGLLARLRLLTQEELELSRVAVEQAGSEKIRAFAKRSEERSEDLDKRLTDHALSAGVPRPEPGSKPLFQRLKVIEKLKGEAFDVDYLKLLLDFHGENVRLYERVAATGSTPELRKFAREGLAAERSHLKTIETVMTPVEPIPRTEATPPRR